MLQINLGLLPVLVKPAATNAPGGQAGAKSPKNVEVEPCLALLGSVERVGKLTGALDALHLVLTEHPSPAALLATGEANGLQVKPSVGSVLGSMAAWRQPSSQCARSYISSKCVA